MVGVDERRSERLSVGGTLCWPGTLVVYGAAGFETLHGIRQINEENSNALCADVVVVHSGTRRVPSDTREATHGARRVCGQRARHNTSVSAAGVGIRRDSPCGLPGAVDPVSVQCDADERLGVSVGARVGRITQQAGVSCEPRQMDTDCSERDSCAVWMDAGGGKEGGKAAAHRVGGDGRGAAADTRGVRAPADTRTRSRIRTSYRHEKDPPPSSPSCVCCGLLFSTAHAIRARRLFSTARHNGGRSSRETDRRLRKAAHGKSSW